MDKIEENFYMPGRGEVYEQTINYVEKMLIERALEHSFGNQAMASKVLGLNRNTLRNKIKKLNIDVKRFKE